MAESPLTSALQNAGRKTAGGVNAGTVHSHTVEEELVFSAYINEVLTGDEDCGQHLPCTPETMYTAIGEGILLCKLINAVVHDDKLLIDRRAINKKKKLHGGSVAFAGADRGERVGERERERERERENRARERGRLGREEGLRSGIPSPAPLSFVFLMCACSCLCTDHGGCLPRALAALHMVENHNLAINSAINIGCRIVNIGATDLMEGRKHLVMGLLWQIIRYGVLDTVSLQACPEIIRLLKEGETVEDLNKLTHEELLLRWFNFHLAAAGSSRKVSNFSTDVADSECYTILLNQVSKNQQDPAKKCSLAPNQIVGDKLGRAAAMLAEAAKIDCEKLITAAQVAAGNPRLNLAFTANIFNTIPGLEQLAAGHADIYVPGPGMGWARVLRDVPGRLRVRFASSGHETWIEKRAAQRVDPAAGGAMAGLKKLLATLPDVPAFFAALDVNGDGYVDAAELEGAAAATGVPLTAAECAVVIELADADGNGLLELAEVEAFAAVLQQVKQLRSELLAGSGD
eukprot:SAG22_NODE_1470_length_4346_cov_26.858724_3_plen_518_part_00